MSLLKVEKYIFPCTRRRNLRKRVCVATIFFVTLFVVYQLIIYNYIISNETVTKKVRIQKGKLIRGTGVEQETFYTAVNEKFTCFKSGETIDFRKVNDNYCDCSDSTDEPGTNACPDGLFYCSNVLPNKYPKMVPSSKVNDGICDCCDGSEEYEKINIMNGLTSTCPNVC